MRPPGLGEGQRKEGRGQGKERRGHGKEGEEKRVRKRGTVHLTDLLEDTAKPQIYLKENGPS